MAYRFTSYDLNRLEATRTYISGNLHKKITTEDMCRLAQMNRNKLNEGFRQLFGKTISRFLYEARMIRARELLLNTELSIGDISEATGYNHYTNFLTAYKRFFLLTAGEDRAARSNDNAGLI
jgi:AraC family transcriptional regulator, transcriptional activator of the genes for pyochelin and ferripyochelin receptors